jgi:hypothetical protein
MIRLSTLLAQTRLELARHQVLAFKGRPLEICCLAGWLWITDGLGGEQVIQGGQRTVVRTKGRICVQALAPSAVRIARGVRAFYFSYGYGNFLLEIQNRFSKNFVVYSY